MTDQELKDEIIARRDAERRLKKAEDSLSRLEAALKEREGIALQQKEHANSASSQSPAENAECPPQEQEKQRTPSVIEEEISASVADLKSKILDRLGHDCKTNFSNR